jgi:hypothetical protein
LNCGHKRDEPDHPCPVCTYVGWAWEKDLDEALRRRLRERPLETRRLRVA